MTGAATSNRHIQGIIFDIDGTLVDSVDLHARAWREALAEFGHYADIEKVRAQIGKGGDELVKEFLTPEEYDRIFEDLDSFRGQHFKARYLPRVRPFSEVPALFERVLARGQRIALGSSAKGNELEVYKRIAGIVGLIHAQTSSDDADKSKPNPDIFHAAVEELGLPHDRIAVVGDTPWDAIAAGKAGLLTVGVLCGGWPEAALREAGCAAVFRGPADLLARYDESPLAST